MPTMVVIPSGSRHTRRVVVNKVSRLLTRIFTCKTLLTNTLDSFCDLQPRSERSSYLSHYVTLDGPCTRTDIDILGRAVPRTMAH